MHEEKQSVILYSPYLSTTSRKISRYLWYNLSRKMILKKYLPIAFTISAGVAFGVFLFAPASKTLYIKNSDSYLASAENKIGDLSNTIIPSINVPKNLTENFAAMLTQEMIIKNSEPQAGEASPESGLTMPDINAITEKFIADGLKQGNENILNIAPPDIKISSDNSKEAIKSYLAEAQKILKDNLKSKPLLPILEEINKNNGQGLEKLLPIISAHEATANQLEKIPVPSDLKDLMTEEIKLLRITANVLRALANVENDPLGTMVATQQFGAVIQNWVELQVKFNNFIKKLNKT
ncbi:hypothetical protein KKH14_01345 [Patescibacteria group bacterium]|nr:hypothetical protein [Patescibacteria group bacterium]